MDYNQEETGGFGNYSIAEDRITGEDLVELKILTTLRIYPRVSPSMLQVAIGPSYAAHFWRPILERLIARGDVLRMQETIVNELTGRYRTAVVICLSEYKLTEANAKLAIPKGDLIIPGDEYDPE